jgi:hypothetical protein
MSRFIFQSSHFAVVSFCIFISSLLTGCVSQNAVSEGKVTGPFKVSDQAIDDAITRKWNSLLDSHKGLYSRLGIVVLEFHFTSDGKITDIKVLENTVGQLQKFVCEEAVLKSGPYPPWPEDMKRMVGVNYRIFKFTFIYR